MSLWDTLPPEAKDEGWQAAEPPQYPVTIRDLELSTDCFDMQLPMADSCPSCGAFNMQVGDYVCWGVCRHCAPPM